MSWLRALLSLLLLGSCASHRPPGPQVTVCISDPSQGGYMCSNTQNQRVFLHFSDSEKYVCMEPGDFKKVLESCGPR
jgi:hypothetical protein